MLIPAGSAANIPGGEAMADLPHVVVIGGGLSGAMVALHLLRDHTALRLRLTVVEPRPRLGAGLAYGTTDPQHRINVAASRMALFREDPLHFEHWLHARADGPDGDLEARLPDGRLYPRRTVFGSYVADTLDQALAAAGDRVRFRHLRDRAAQVTRPGGDADAMRIDLAAGAPLRADLLVLALGHAPPAPPPFLRQVPPSRLVADPWTPDALAAIAPEAAVLVVGTGLTASDVFASLHARGHAGPILAISRHGLLPRPRTTLAVAARGDFATAPARTALALLRRVRDEVRAGDAAGRPWEDVVDALRRDAPMVWRTLPLGERQRLLRHLRTVWDVHRFQCAPQIQATTDRLLRTGRLSVQAGRIDRVLPGPDGRLSVEYHRRGGGPAQRTMDAVINCTGPGHRPATLQHPVLVGLAEQGVVQPDPYGFGLQVDAQSRAVPAPGVAAGAVFVAGPMARSAHGELMGLPQISLQPREIAALLAASAGRPGALPLDPAKGSPLATTL